MTRSSLSRAHRLRAAAASVAVALFVVFGPVIARSAAADTPAAPDARARAQELLVQGNAQFRERHYAEALAHFIQARALYPSPKLEFNIGQCHRALGQPIEALEAFELFVDKASDAAPALRAEARGYIAELTGVVATVELVGGTPGALVSIDGRRAGALPLGRTVRVLPGQHALTIEVPGEAALERPFTATVGVPARVDLERTPAARPTTPERPRLALATTPQRTQGTLLATPPPPEQKRSLLRSLHTKWWFWTGLGAAVAAGTVATILYMRRDPPCPEGDRSVGCY